ncbi:MAG: sulfate permease [Candidatus Palauibacterales bacterium]|nr:sulfate permease [Candidatus Palauibacterales bacterium]
MNNVKNVLEDVFPILKWGGDYGLEAARSDLVAGLTVGVMLIPQGMAYAVLAGLPPIYGLFASLVPLVVYPLMGTSRHLAVGISAVSMVVVAAGVGQIAEPGTDRYVTLAILLTAMVGLVEVAMGAARLGFLANLISRPVIAGFSTAAAVIIGAGQLGNLLGVELGRSEYVHQLVADAVAHLGQADSLSLSLGLGSLVVVLLFQRWKPLFPSELAVLVVGTVLAWALGLGEAGVELVGSIPSGLPAPRIAAVDLGSVRDLLPTVFTLALVQFMAVVSLGRVFATRHRYTIDPNQELVALGASNVFGSLFQSLPASGSFSRTSVNEQAGARTALSNVFAAALIAGTLLFLTDFFYYVPMPVLAAIIIVAGLGLIDPAEIRYLYLAKRADGYVALVTFLTTLGVGIQEGILVGIGAATLAVLYRISRPHVAELGHLRATRSFKNLNRFSKAEPVEGLLVLRVEAGFSFFNAKFLRDFIMEKTQEEGRNVRAVVLDGMSINYLDTTAVESLEEIANTLDEWEVELHFAGLTGPIRDVVEDSGLGSWLGEEHFHIDPYHAVLHILERWDEEEGSDRAEAYRAEVEKEEEEVQPTAESPFT